MSDINTTLLLLQKTLDLNQEMLDCLIDAAGFIEKFCKDNKIPLPEQQTKRIKSVTIQIKTLSIRMVEHMKEFHAGVDK